MEAESLGCPRPFWGDCRRKRTADGRPGLTAAGRLPASPPPRRPPVGRPGPKLPEAGV